MDRDQIAGCFVSDKEFDSLYPMYIQELSAVHWTPLHVAFNAAHFLAPDENARVLDIGAGVGKFCIAGGFGTKGNFTGIEQRKNFVKIGNKLIKRLELPGVEMIYGNFTDLDLGQYTGIYFFNSFHENLVTADSLDDKVALSPELYTFYTSCLFARLDEMRPGTRLATYWLTVNEVPGSYRLHETFYEERLKLWIKER